MNPNELNKYLLNYMNIRQVPGAVMITAPWGAGKSHYVNNSLIPFLKECLPNKKSVTTSLYSVNDIGSLCKGLFLQSILNKPRKRHKTIEATKLVAKTLYNGAANHWSIDFNCSEKEYYKLFSLLNLSETLVILEDLERTKIPILDLMGFVNSLTENDNVRVLLVANESELLSDLEKESDKYLKIKEKTVYDTIKLDSVNIDAINGILASFGDTDKIKAILADSTLAENIFHIMCEKEIDCYNLRSLKYALQKTVDLVNQLSFSPDSDFLKHILLSIVAFTFKKKKRDDLCWVDDMRSPAELATSEYPLLKSCYNYIDANILDEESLKNANNSFINRRNYESKQSSIKPHLDVIFSFYRKTENEVKSSLEFFSLNPTFFKEMPIMDRIHFFNYILAIEELSICPGPISKCKGFIYNSFADETFEYEPGAYSSIKLNSNEAINQWIKFNEYIQDLSTSGKDQLFGFDYTMESISEIKENARKGYYTGNRKFVSLIDLDRLIEMIKQCNAAQIEELRHLFLHVYGFTNIYDVFMDDLPQLKELRGKVGVLEKNSDFDAIQKLQLNYFISNIDTFIEKLESHSPPVNSAVVP